MEARNMNIHEIAPRASGIVASPPEAPTLPRPKTEPAPVSPEPKKHPTKKRLGLCFRLAGALLAMAGAGAPAIKHHLDFEVPNTPAGIIGDIKSIPFELEYTIARWQQDKTVSEKLNKPVLSTFDNKADGQIIQAGINAVPISEEELPSLLKDTIKPVEKGKFPEPTIFLPMKLKDGEKVDIRTYWVKNAYNPINPESKDPIAYGKIFTIAKKGTEIIVPVEGAKVSLGTTVVQDKRYVSSYGISFYGPDGTKYSLALMTPEDMRLLKPTDLINNVIAAGNRILDLPTGTPIATTSADNVEMRAVLFAYPPDTKDKESISCNFNLITKEENGRATIAFLPQSSP